LVTIARGLKPWVIPFGGWATGSPVEGSTGHSTPAVSDLAGISQ
jgi:hypothetical protein